MVIDLKWPPPLENGGKKLLIYLIATGILIGFLPVFEPENQEIDLVLISDNLNSLATIEGNSLLPIAEPINPKPPATRKIWVVATAYSSTPWETDGNPYITAAGTWVRDGIVANNFLPIGTKIRIPELFGDKIFVVEDRMNWKKGNYQIDIWFPNYWDALNFGAKKTYIEILES